MRETDGDNFVPKIGFVIFFEEGDFLFFGQSSNFFDSLIRYVNNTARRMKMLPRKVLHFPD